MDIKDVIKRKNAAEEKISKLIFQEVEKLQRETELNVLNISVYLTAVQEVGSVTRKLLKAEAKVDLEL